MSEQSTEPDMIVVDGIRYRREHAPDTPAAEPPDGRPDGQSDAGMDSAGTARHKARTPAEKAERGG